jgi:hypothetical protein
MSVKDKVTCTERATKAIYGTIGVIGGFYVRLFEDVGPHSISNKTIISHLLVLSHLSFFGFEMFTQMIYDIKSGFIAMDVLIHHSISLVIIDLFIFLARKNQT